MRLFLSSLAALGLAACGHSIGDSCQANVDCDPNGNRYCDLASPGGYCTMEGCDSDTCPGDSVCIRFFEQLPTKPCDQETADEDCLPSERCLCDCGHPDQPGVCLTPTEVGSAADGTLVIACPDSPDVSPPPTGPLGHCAPESSERRWCQKKCGSDSDCRSGYECRRTGTHGCEPVPDRTVGETQVPAGPPASFCVRRAA